MCSTCSSIKLQELVKSVAQASKTPVSGLSYQHAQKLESFLNTLAVQAVTNANRREFIALFKENDLEKISVFINKYVTDFPQKLHRFLIGEMKE